MELLCTDGMMDDRSLGLEVGSVVANRTVHESEFGLVKPKEQITQQ